MNNTYKESVQFHIDSTVPDINNIWLIKGNHRQLFVHSGTDLSKMTLSFDAMDSHSGIRTVKWSLGTTDGGSDIGHGATGVKKLKTGESCGNVSSCYCPSVGNCEIFSYTVNLNSLVANGTHDGDHNRQYFFTILVTNNALLAAVERIDILVDDSPPEKGVVFEGPVSSPDIDFTSIDSVIVHWHGFIDHESGIKIYSVGVNNRCLTKDEMIKGSSGNITQTAESVTRIALADEGKYFITVIAYNYAMDPSDPACSDGVSRDLSHPIIENITLKNAQVADSIACSNGIAWLIRHNVSKFGLIQTEACSDRCKNSSWNQMVEAIREDIKKVTDEDISQFYCSRLQDFTTSLIYLPKDTVYLTWDIFDEISQIHDVSVGYGTSPFSADVINFRSTNHKTHYKDHHSGLSSGSEFYVFIKIQNKAGLETILPFGPLLIDETPPICTGFTQIRLEDQHVTLTWNNDTFYDFEQKESIGIIMFQIGYLDRMLTPYYEWNIRESAKCTGISGGCIKYPIDKLQQHNTENETPFFFRLHVYNYAGHFCSIDTEKFNIPSKFSLGHGYVIDLPIGSLTNYLVDIDISFTPYTYCASWSGFWHHMGMKYEIGVGTTPVSDDVISFHSVNDTDKHCENSSLLIENRRYFVTIIARCSGGIANATSNGFIILNKDHVSDKVTVYDGKGCTENDIIDEVTEFVENTSAEIDFQSETNLLIGRSYTLTIQAVGKNELHIFSKGALIRTDQSYRNINQPAKFESNKIQFIPTIHRPLFQISNVGQNSSSVQRVRISACEDDIEVFPSNSKVSVHWKIPRNINVSHVNVRLWKRCTDVINETLNCPLELYASTVSGMKSNFVHENVHYSGNYFFEVQACFENECLNPKRSNGFVIDDLPLVPEMIDAKLYKSDAKCFELNIRWDVFLCANSSATFYRWSIFRDDDAYNMISEINVQYPVYDKIQSVQTCIDIPVYLHSELFACVQGFCPSGLSATSCKYVDAITNPNEYSRNTVYDIDLRNIKLTGLLDTLHSRYLGHNLSILHTHEIDFALSTVNYSGVVVGGGGSNIQWFLMKDPHIPTNCFDDATCIETDTSSSGYVSFKNNLLDGHVYYTCAISIPDNSSTVTIDLDETEISACSDGVLIDNTKPVAGKVKVHNRNGYIIDSNQIVIEWEKFTDSEKYILIGYENGIKNYEYAIGTYPGGQDVQRYTHVLSSNTVTIRNLDLTPGLTYFASVSATDFVGLCAVGVSDGVVFDDTPPSKGMIHVGSIHHQIYLISTDNINVQWMGFYDKESGISKYELGIGTRNYTTDVVPFQLYDEEFAYISYNEKFQDGRNYYAILRVTNGAGLSTTVTSLPFVLDDSPPITGLIYQGTTESKENKNYQLNTTVLQCHWHGFHDPHSYIRYYRVGLGTAPLFTNVIPLVSVGLRQDMIWKHNLEPGVRYYVTVEACNGARLCSKTSSNGIVLDNSPPIPGLVHIGLTGKHSKYIPQQSFIEAQWFGFEDPQSDIEHFEVCIGSSNICDIMPYTNFLLSSSLTKTNLNLPVGIPLYVTVKAVNKAGLFVERSSDTFMVDNTAPTIIAKPKVIPDELTSRNLVGIQVDPSILKIIWNFTDEESYIARQTLTLKTHHDGHSPIEHMELLPSATSIKLQFDPKSWLADGDRYFAMITACNAADICSSAQSSDILIDSTPPSIGGFKPPLTWRYIISEGKNITRLHLTWYGFSDVESNITDYVLTASKHYSGSELSNGSIYVNHNGSQYQDQSLAVDIDEPLKQSQKLILSIWAQNGAELKSRVAKSTVNVVSSDTAGTSGFLELEKHSCDTHYCNKDCTCAVLGRVCSDKQRNDTCNEVADSDVLTDLITIKIGWYSNSVKFSSSSACLVAKWEINSSIFSVDRITRFEWSAGILNGKIGEGIFDLLFDKIWHDVGLNNHVVHCLPMGQSLNHGEEYVFYIRAWFSPNQFKQYTSLPVAIDLTPPSIRRGKFVIDSDGRCDRDLEYSSIKDSLTACWNGVFSDQQSGITSYKVSLGTSSGGDDIKRTQTINLIRNITWTGLALVPGTKYFTTVTAVNGVGLEMSTTSDGIVIDHQAPVTGSVFNTKLHHNILYQSSNSTIAASWHGFEDPHSFVRKYEVSILERYNDTNTTVLPFMSVGIRTSLVLEVDIFHGHYYFVAVKAFDAAGFQSEIGTSPEVFVDITPPVAFKCHDFINVYALYNATIDSSWKGNITFARDQRYRITLLLRDISADAMIDFAFGEFAVSLPVVMLANGSIESVYDFVSPDDGPTEVQIYIHNTETSFLSELVLSNCIAMVTESAEGLILRQLSPSSISVCVNVYDPESGIQRVDIGVGTTKGGFQIRSLQPLEIFSHMVMDVQVPHRSPVHATAIVYNHAGLTSHHFSQPLTIDHTPPEIWDQEILLEYELNAENKTRVNARINWKDQDNESNVQFCYCALGSRPSSTNIADWIMTYKTSVCDFSDVSAAHGDQLFGLVKCVNHIELIRYASTDPVTVLYLPPDPNDSKPSFITLGSERVSENVIQRNTSSLLVIWDTFQYYSDLMTYECRISHHSNGSVTSLIDWVNVGRRNAVMVNHLKLMDGRNYSAEVRAVGFGKSMSSNVTRSDVLIESRTPTRTGTTVEIIRSNHGLVTIDWSSLFESRDGTPLTYYVTIGSRRGFADVLFMRETRRSEFNISVEEDLGELYVAITATTDTGIEITHREAIPLH